MNMMRINSIFSEKKPHHLSSPASLSSFSLIQLSPSNPFYHFKGYLTLVIESILKENSELL